ncbi:MAG TPA: two-component regulator propeller domain-containing protein, partial [Desulfuromonadaceae bacterium]|nr:two-component regulator propeller domain-containing protein [Desulfuromonadaceae bacterium]
MTTTDSAWSLRVWQSDDDLPNNNVTGIAQTHDSYLWIATQTRVTRFDGDHFESIARHLFAPGTKQRVSKLLASRGGGLWLAMDHGPLFYAHTGEVQTYTNGLPDGIVESLTEDRDGGVWIVYRGTPVCRLKNGTIKKFAGAEGLPDWNVCSLALDGTGRLWFAKGGWVGVFTNEHFVPLWQLATRNTTVRVAAASDGGIWIAAGAELYKAMDKGNPQKLGVMRPDMVGAQPSALMEDRDGGVWIGTTSAGLFHYDGSDFEKVPTSHREILSLLEDREGNMWVGTGGGGLNQIQSRAIALENNASGLPYESLRSVSEDNRGALWAVTQGGLLLCRERGVWSTISTNQLWRGDTITCVVADKSGDVWIGTANADLFRLRDGHLTLWTAGDGIVSHTIHTLMVASNGDLWIGGTAPAQLQRLRNGQFKNFAVPRSAGVVRAMAEDAAGNIWAGSNKGTLVRVAGDQLVDETARLSTTNSIRTLYATPEGSIWIGYAGHGLGRLKNDRISHVTADQGLYDDFISEIVADGKGWLWFGADHGIFKVREQELLLASEQSRSHVHSIHYGRGDGLPSLQANFDQTPNAWRGRDGKIWMPMSTALAVVNPDNFHGEASQPPVLLNRVMVDDEPVASYGGIFSVATNMSLDNPGGTLKLPPGYHRLEFDFTALSFSAPENIVFEYCLKGFDDDWVEAGTDRMATYSRLAAGNYQFLIRARNGNGYWTRPVTAVNLNVAPFLWQTWWFQSTIVLTFTLFVIAIVRYVSFRRLQSRVRLLERQAVLDKERGRIARDIHDQL